jgi:formylglycine-generating enzyme required for sulfatase activity
VSSEPQDPAPPLVESPSIAEVFISYAREDRRRAEMIATALRDEKFEVWWDDKIPIGADFRSTLDARLDATRSVLVLWSKDSVISRWVREEADSAQERGKLIPACIDDVRPPIGFRSAQCAQLVSFDGNRDHPEFRKLCDAIRQVIAAAAVHGAIPAKAGVVSTTTTSEHSLMATPARDGAAGLRAAGGGDRWRRTLLLAGLAVGTSVATIVFIPERGRVKTGRDGLTYRRISAGEFIMGCDRCEVDERPAHRVRISADFWITETEITVDAYRRFATASGREMPPQTARPEANPAEFNPRWREGTHPIVNVNHDDATQYCRWAGGPLPWNRGNLPTEAQWEYAARGGSLTSFPWGNQISRDKANYGYKDPLTAKIHPRASERGARDQWLFTSPVASFEPNGFGLFDTVGNVQEWNRDAFRPYAADAEDPYVEPVAASDERVVRGGSFLYDQDDSRVENRSRNPPDERYPDTGFRCVLPVRRLW